MSLYLESAGVLFLTILAVAICDGYVKHLRRISITPPGPRSLPFLGNSLSISHRAPWKTYAGWGQEYQSDLVSVRALWGDHTIVVNTKKAAQELFERRSSNYSDRPQTTMISLMGWDWATSLMPYTERWRLHRKLLHHFFHEKAAEDFLPLQTSAAARLVLNIAGDPENASSYISGFSAGVVMSLTYGYDIKSKDDHFVNIARRSVGLLSDAVLPGASIVNALPWLRHLPPWIPGAKFLAWAKECTDLTIQMRTLPFDFVKTQMAQGTARASMVSSMLQNRDAQHTELQDEEVLMEVAAMTYAAGSDTTMSALFSGVLALVLHPLVQSRARKELDAVVGRDRLPTFEDRKLLPYVTAVCREILRWNPVLPLGLARAALRDDEYDGYFIPAGTKLLYNTWAILHDPQDYPEPEAFKPERFLKDDETLNNDEVGPAFGFGRRGCSGLHHARSSLWIAIASILSVFNVVNTKDEDGRDVLVNVEYSNGSVSHPLPFSYSLKPRDDQAKKLLEEAQYQC